MQCNSEWHRIEQRTPTFLKEKPFWGCQTIGTVQIRATLGIYTVDEKFTQSLNFEL